MSRIVRYSLFLLMVDWESYSSDLPLEMKVIVPQLPEIPPKDSPQCQSSLGIASLKKTGFLKVMPASKSSQLLMVMTGKIM